MDYKAQDGSGRSWTRANQFTVFNPLDGTPMARFHEEQVVSLGEKTVAIPDTANPGGVGVAFNPETAFQLLNPETGEATGESMTHAQLYVILYSLYIDAALARDARLAAANATAPAPEEPTPPEPTPNPF